MSEEDLQRQIINLARLYNIKVAHFPPSKSVAGKWMTAVAADAKGYPDLTLVGTRVLFRENKTDRGTLSPEQKQWIADLRAAGADVDVWRPRDWHSGRIRAELEAIRVRPGQRTEKASA
ncbi:MULTISPECIES: VRR-NUC domain-containing protein [unclassified Micromonospora]|uniref:VRR-NUC domain-containing protein n=1 Tax=unclassified Micromonospora TaxID=2617518 RepID=UPI00331E3FCF